MTSWARKLAPSVALLACCAPLFAMTVRGWTNAVLFLSALLAIVLLARGRLPAAPGNLRREVILVLVALTGPLVATIASALLRADPYPSQFDAPLRLALAVPVFLLAVRLPVDASRAFQWIAPVSLLLVAAHRAYFGQPEDWPAERVTTAFVDPLVFGYLSLALALMCLMSISLRAGERSSPAQMALALLGIVVGVTLSVLSGSRSGWLAIPVMVGVWLHMNVPATRRFGRGAVPLTTVLAAVLIGAGAYSALPKVHHRIHEAVDDVTSYSFAGKAPESPVGLRITYLRIAGDIVAQHPFAGIGDTAHAGPPPDSRFPYATHEAVRSAFESAFHNQIVTDTVRHGLLGGIAAALMLLVPLAIHARGLRSGDACARRNAALGIAWGTCIFVSSFSTEVVDLKYTASLYALMTAILSGGALARHGQD